MVTIDHMVQMKERIFLIIDTASHRPYWGGRPEPNDQAFGKTGK